ncbi:MAG: anti-sigma regulatory factor [Gemmatimonadaceae bacterium]
MAKTETVPLRSEQDIVLARRLVRRLTQELGFSLVDQTKMVTAASELARNAYKYGGGGDMLAELVEKGSRSGVRLTFEDHGAGIPDVAQAMTDGWTSGGGLGMGLSGAKRLVHEFGIETVLGEGTSVTITRWV